MLEVKKVTRKDEEIETEIRRSLKDFEQGEHIDIACYPIADDCCIKKGASS